MTVNSAVDRRRPFASLVIAELADLIDSGFSIAEAGETIVKLARNGVEVDVYWGQSSYEVSAGIAFDGERYSLSELIGLSNTNLAVDYRNPTATTEDLLGPVVAKVTYLLKVFGAPAFSRPDEVACELRTRRAKWSREFALDSLARVTRPAAEDAFRRHDFAKAAELYSKIAGRLSEAELRKLDYAKTRSAPKH